MDISIAELCAMVPDFPVKEIGDMSSYGVEFDRKRVYAEKAYRRGYTQGLAEAIRAMEAGASVDALNDYMCDLLETWRYEKTHQVIFPPPFNKQ